MKRTKIVEYGFSLTIACVIVYFCFRNVSWDVFFSQLKECSWGYIIAAMLVGCASYLVRALRWQLLLPGAKLADTFNAVNIGNISNFVIPRIGEVVRCGIVSQRSPANTFEKTLGTVVLERSIDVLCLGLLLLGTIAVFGGQFMEFIEENVVSGLAGYSAVIWIAAGLILAAVIAFFSVNLPQPQGRGKLYSFIYGLHKGVRDCFRMDGKLMFLLYTVILWGCFFTMSYLTIRAVPALGHLGAADALFLSLVGSLGWAIPTPGGIGSYHAIIALALSQIYGMSWEAGIIFATISHESQSITMIVCGLGSYAANTLRQ